MLNCFSISIEAQCSALELLKKSDVHAGTPLGDPIEIGALAAVLSAAQSTPQPSNLTLAASKSWIGHSEPAAGAVGMAHLCLALTQQAALPVMHLKELNPHVHPMLHPSKAGHRGAYIPRQAGGLIGRALGAEPFHAGVSAFAFQGTNAHVIMAASTASDSTDCRNMLGRQTVVQFQQQRHWLAPPPHALLLTAVAANETLTFHADLTSSASAFLLDHVVSEQCLLPATAFLELAYSSTKLGLTAQATDFALLDTTLSAPLQLAEPQASRGTTSGIVSVQLAMHTAAVSVFSHNTAHGQYHAFASVTTHTSADHTHLASNTAHILSAVCDFKGAAGVVLEPAEAAPAIGSLAQPVSGTDAFTMHPASADSAFHLATSFETSSSSMQLRVPAKLQAMHIFAAAAAQPVWTSATPSLESQPSSRTHTFGLVTNDGSCHVAHQGLMLKPLSNAPLALPHDIGAASVQNRLYELTWPADMVHSDTSNASKGLFPLKRGQSSMQATAAAIGALQRLQQQSQQQQVLSVTAGHVGSMPGRPAATALGAAAQASLMRTAAQELASCQVSCQTLDLLTPASAASTGTAACNVFSLQSFSVMNVASVHKSFEDASWTMSWVHTPNIC